MDYRSLAPGGVGRFMSRRGKTSGGTPLRRLVQIAFLLAFFALVLLVRPRPDGGTSPLWKLFFLFDPLILLTTWLTTHALWAAGLLSLAVVAVTVVLGRVFCGWICPLGTVHAIAGWILFRFWPDRKHRDHWSPWQRPSTTCWSAVAMALLGGHWVCDLRSAGAPLSHHRDGHVSRHAMGCRGRLDGHLSGRSGRGPHAAQRC